MCEKKKKRELTKHFIPFSRNIYILNTINRNWYIKRDDDNIGLYMY